MARLSNHRCALRIAELVHVNDWCWTIAKFVQHRSTTVGVDCADSRATLLRCSFLPMTEFESGVVLERTRGELPRVIVASQILRFSGLSASLSTCRSPTKKLSRLGIQHCDSRGRQGTSIRCRRQPRFHVPRTPYIYGYQSISRKSTAIFAKSAFIDAV